MNNDVKKLKCPYCRKKMAYSPQNDIWRCEHCKIVVCRKIRDDKTDEPMESNESNDNAKNSKWKKVAIAGTIVGVVATAGYIIYKYVSNNNDNNTDDSDDEVLLENTPLPTINKYAPDDTLLENNPLPTIDDDSEDTYTDIPDWSGFCPDCPVCGSEMGYSYFRSEFKCPYCNYTMDEDYWDYDPGEIDGVPWGCFHCGGPYPLCVDGCKDD